MGAVLWELVFDGPFRGPIEARRKAVWNVTESKYEFLGIPAAVRIADIEVERFQASARLS